MDDVSDMDLDDNEESFERSKKRMSIDRSNEYDKLNTVNDGQTEVIDKIFNCSKDGLFYYDEDCVKCQDLSKETLLKIAKYLRIVKGDETYYSKDRLCAIIEINLSERRIGSKPMYFRDYDGLKRSHVFSLFDTEKDREYRQNLFGYGETMPVDEIFNLLKETEYYVLTYPKYRSIWDFELDRMWKKSFESHKNDEDSRWYDALKQFGAWKMNEEFKDNFLKNALQLAIRDCEKTTTEEPSWRAVAIVEMLGIDQQDLLSNSDYCNMLKKRWQRIEKK